MRLPLVRALRTRAARVGPRPPSLLVVLVVVALSSGILSGPRDIATRE